MLGVHHEQNKVFLSHLSLIYNMKDRVMMGAKVPKLQPLYSLMILEHCSTAKNGKMGAAT